MTFSAILSRWFGLPLSSARPDSAPALLVLSHYEEDDEYGDDDGPEEAADADRSPDAVDRARDSYFRPSALFAASYEEEAAHLDDAELLSDAEELLLEA